MPFSKREKIILATIIALILLIPLSSLVIAQRINSQNLASKASTEKTPLETSPSGSTLSSSLDELKKNLGATSDEITTDNSSSQLSFGPTLTFSINIEGRPSTNQAAKLFLGLAQGGITTSPQYLLSFKVSVPSTGTPPSVSLAGLTQGTTYTAYIKGPSQIATSSSFLVRPTETNIGTLNMISGDLNEDNIIDTQDLTIINALLGTTPNSSNWNPNADLNSDGVVNSFDRGIVQKNQGKIGAGGPWYSKISQLATPLTTPPAIGSPSATLTATDSAKPSGSLSEHGGGYWMWVPEY
jgi:hypothetical protein